LSKKQLSGQRPRKFNIAAIATPETSFDQQILKKVGGKTRIATD
jgi:hypothetical protein